MANERDNEIWDDATNAVCQAMQDQKMCNCPDGDCLAAKVDFSPDKIATSTRPASPVEGLETVGHIVSHDAEIGSVEEAVVYRSQAEAIIAAERARYHALEEIAAGLVERTDKAKADNAALTARVKELEGDIKTHVDGTTELVNEKIDAEFKAIDLETQLAAAKKAIEVYGPYTPTWLGPCVWAGIKEELPPQLVDREVWISTSNPNEVKP